MNYMGPISSNKYLVLCVISHLEFEHQHYFTLFNKIYNPLL